MVDYQRNAEDLKRALREHSISGYPIKVPIWDLPQPGISTSSIKGLTSVLVGITDSTSFSALAQFHGWGNEKIPLEDWVKYAKEMRMPRADTHPLQWMHPYSIAMLEDGYSVSMQDIKRAWLKALGHVDNQDMVVKYSFDLSKVRMDPSNLQPGMIVEFQDNPPTRERSRAPAPPVVGRVLAVEQDTYDQTPVVFLETFEPVPATLAPEALSPWMINPSFVPNKTWALGYGTYDALKRKRVKIPRGMFDPKDEHKRTYFLDEPLPLSVIQEFCEKHFPKDPQCVWQSMVFLVLPIHSKPDPKGRHPGGSFKPYPDDIRPTEVEAQIDYFSEGLEFED